MQGVFIRGFRKPAFRYQKFLLVPLFERADRPLGTLRIEGCEGKQFDAGHSRVMSELDGFSGLAMRMITDAKTLKEAVDQQETLTRELSQ
jgi:hypothetical protein